MLERRNEVELTGKVASEPEFKKVGDLNILNFSILHVSTSSSIDKETGEVTEKTSTCFKNCNRFIKENEIDAYRKVVTKGNVVSIKGYLMPEHYTTKEGRVVDDYRFTCQQIIPYVKAVEGEKSNRLNNYIISGNLGRDAEWKGNNMLTYSLAFDNGKEGDKKLSGWLNVTQLVKKDATQEVRDQLTELLKKGTAVTLSGRFEANEYADKDGVRHQNMRVIATEAQKTRQLETTNALSSDSSTGLVINRDELISQNVSMVSTLVNEGVDVERLSDKQLYSLLSKHRSLELNGANGRKQFTPQKGVDNSYRLIVTPSRQMEARNETEK